MMRKIFLSLLLPLGPVLFFSCEGESPNPKTINAEKHFKKPLIEANKRSAQTESDQIENYIERHKWDVKETGTGLRYLIYEEGNGPVAKKGDIAVVDYEVSLLNGKVCYSTKGKEPQEFLIGRDNVESGLHEGVQQMKVGDKAKLIIPSHLAHGLLGDQKKIPPKSTVIYDIELKALK